MSLTIKNRTDMIEVICRAEKSNNESKVVAAFKVKNSNFIPLRAAAIYALWTHPFARAVELEWWEKGSMHFLQAHYMFKGKLIAVYYQGNQVKYDTEGELYDEMLKRGEKILNKGRK